MTIINFVIPAGGVGSRMQMDKPKQYLELVDGKSILEVTLGQLINSDCFDSGVVGIADDDHFFKALPLSPEKFFISHASDTRAKTVLNALLVLKEHYPSDSWVFVHDAARPCLSIKHIKAFIKETVGNTDIGAIMAIPVVDTVKKVMDNKIIETIDRSTIWLAQTPQMFKLGLLIDAYEFCLKNNIHVTDESSAIEAFGYSPIVIKGHKHNIKITIAEDLELARKNIKEFL